jgi:hypothetical protein
MSGETHKLDRVDLLAAIFNALDKCGVLPSLRRFSAARYVLLFVSSSAHAFARPELGILSPRGVVFQ